jgi:hypothetical protein
MLMQLLALIGRGGVQLPAELAVELGVSGGLLEAMLVDLGRMGYLAPLHHSCGPDACPHCPSGCSVPAADGSPGWLLTAKGRRALGR